MQPNTLFNTMGPINQYVHLIPIITSTKLFTNFPFSSSHLKITSTNSIIIIIIIIMVKMAGIEKSRELKIYVVLLLYTFPRKARANNENSDQLDGACIVVISLFLILVATTTAYFIRKFGCHVTNTSNNPLTQNNQSNTTVARGVDVKAVVGEIPTVSMAEVEVDQVECVVCLSEFRDEDMLQIMPICLHVFHANCISLWLATHFTCPICRASLLEHKKICGADHNGDDNYVSMVDIEVC
ncbi:hypothetical protein RND81_01G176800 [Saponaria officinalis]|uniref:RING-type E3 ubiquitin transferase n=1 Tax=Saponaria officinalis TaxID=3572 RepID=A0AAW1N8D0_SAPOF